MTVQTGSLAPAAPSGSLAETGNSVNATPAGSLVPADASRVLASPVTGTVGTSIWLSVVMQGPGISGSTAQGALVLSDGVGNGFSITTGSTGGGIPPTNPAPSSNCARRRGYRRAEATSSIPDTLQSLLVAKVTFGAANDTISLYVNPALGGGPPASPTISLAVPHAATLSQFDVDYGSLSSGSTMFDEIRLGHTFADVTPVPEPSSLLLAGIAGIGLLVRRRNRTT